jgi:putative ABC transport system permease protein
VVWRSRGLEPFWVWHWFAMARVASGILYEVSPADPLTFTAAPRLLMAVAAVASYVPVRRAMRTDPIVALRAE